MKSLKLGKMLIMGLNLKKEGRNQQGTAVLKPSNSVIQIPSCFSCRLSVAVESAVLENNVLKVLIKQHSMLSWPLVINYFAACRKQ